MSCEYLIPLSCGKSLVTLFHGLPDPGKPYTAGLFRKLPAKQEMWETWFGSLGWDDPLEEEMATCSCILPWEIPRTEEPGGLQCIGSQRVAHDKQLSAKIQ